MSAVVPKYFSNIHGSSNPKKALEEPRIKELLQTSAVEYTRLPAAVLFRQATAQDVGSENALTTWIIDHRGQLVVESYKEFTKGDVDKGIYILRYPAPLGKGKTGALVYNEWFMGKREFGERYRAESALGQHAAGMPGYKEAFAQGEVKRRGILVDPEVIEVLGGADGTALLMAPWGLPMRCVLGGLLTQDGYSIGPGILRDQYVATPPPHAAQTSHGLKKPRQ